MIKFVFSALYNESSEFLRPYIDNFLNYSDAESALIINLSTQVKIPENLSLNSRVKIIYGEVTRSAMGASLLAGHIEVFHAAKSLYPDFNWFITTASNTLFIRNFDGNLAIKEACSRQMPPPPMQFLVYWNDLPNQWQWPKFKGFDAAATRLREHWGVEGLFAGQIEGQFASREDWGRVAEVSTDLENLWSGLQAPLEEILPHTVIDALGSGHRTTICQVHWSRPEGRDTQMRDLVDLHKLPSHVCTMKWFQRDDLTTETLMLTTNIGRNIIKGVREITDNKSRLQLQLILNGALSELDLRTEPQLIRLPEIPFSAWEISAERQFRLLDGTEFHRTAPYLPFLLLEDTKTRLNIEAEISVEGKIRLSCENVDNINDNSKDLQGYAYFPLPKTKTQENFHVRCVGFASGLNASSFVKRFVFHVNNYNVLRPLRVQEDFVENSQAKFLAEFSIPSTEEQSYIGVPLQGGAVIKFRLLILQHKDSIPSSLDDGHHSNDHLNK